jgi:long-chain acyl-CoA synthetase
MVPSHLQLLRDFKLGNKIRSIVTAGEKLTANLASEIRSVFPEALLTEYYGTAELGHITFHQNSDISSNQLSVGSAFPEVQISIQNNQLYVDSPYVSPAYKKLKTVGDLGTWENGKLVLLGRAGKMFNRRGLNIFAQEIEQKALSNKWVKEACLVEIVRDNHQKLVLFFSITPYSSPKAARSEALAKYLKALLPLAKRPNQLVEVEAFPRSPNGKVSEKGLKLMLNYVDEEAIV